MTASEVVRQARRPAVTGSGRGGTTNRREAAGTLRLLPALGAALGGGLLTFLAYPGHDLWPMAPVGVAALVLAARGQSLPRAALVGFVFGAGLVTPLLSWTGVYLGPIASVPLSAAESGYYLLAGVVIAAVHRLPRGGAGGTVLRVLGTAGAWVAAEALQSRWPFGGFGWTRLVFSQADAPTAHLAALGGAPLVSFAVAAAGALLAEAVAAAVRPSPAPRRASGSVAAAAAAIGVVAVGLAVPTPVGAQEGTLDVAAVQGDVPQAGLEFNAQRRAVLDNHARGSARLADEVASGQRQSPDLVVWPENASDIDPFRAGNTDAAALIDAAALEVDAPLLLGTLVHRADGLIGNTSLLWEPGVGPTDSYVKRHPVPFAEYIPYRSFFRLITDTVDLVGTDFAAGTEPGVVPVAGTTLGVLICFEVVEDGLVADVVDGAGPGASDGARLLVVQTNNATFGYTDESVQQLAMSRVRAVETGRAVVHVSTVGVSSMIMPDGTATQRTPLFEPALLQADLPLRSSETVATWLRRHGVPLEGLLAGSGLVIGAAGLVRGARPGNGHRAQRGPATPQVRPARSEQGGGGTSSLGTRRMAGGPLRRGRRGARRCDAGAGYRSAAW